MYCTHIDVHVNTCRCRCTYSGGSFTTPAGTTGYTVCMYIFYMYMYKYTYNVHVPYKYMYNCTMHVLPYITAGTIGYIHYICTCRYIYSTCTVQVYTNVHMGKGGHFLPSPLRNSLLSPPSPPSPESSQNCKIHVHVYKYHYTYIYVYVFGAFVLSGMKLVGFPFVSFFNYRLVC